MVLKRDSVFESAEGVSKSVPGDLGVIGVVFGDTGASSSGLDNFDEVCMLRRQGIPLFFFCDVIVVHLLEEGLWSSDALLDSFPDSLLYEAVDKLC